MDQVDYKIFKAFVWLMIATIALFVVAIACDLIFGTHILLIAPGCV